MRVMLVLFVAFGVQAKEPWEWTVGERITARTDPAQIRRRVETARQSGSAHAQAAVAARTADVLSGARNPELFLPTEIISNFVASAYAVDDDVAKGFQQAAAIQAQEAGLPTEFLTVFEREGAFYIEAAKQDRALRDAADIGVLDPISAHAQLRVLEETELCPRRSALVERMRELYGVSFDRFLYAGIVVGMSRTYVGRSPAADELSRQMRGCRGIIEAARTTELTLK